MSNLISKYTLAGLAILLSLAVDAGAQTVYYVHTDALGSVVAESNVSGAIISQREYEPYGQQLTPALADGPGYTGHVQDAATALTYMQQRYYDPQLGLFLSVDPVTSYDNPITQFHRYRYANNNPYSFTDPDGRESGPIRAMERDHRGYLSGRMSQQEVAANRDVRGIGAAAATAVVAAVVAAPSAVTAVLANPGAVATATEIAAGAAGVTGTAGAVSKLVSGPFAGASIPARSAAQTFTSAERAAINKIGQTTGCHTCGTTTAGTKTGNFVPDHQPVSSLNTTNAPQQLLPQCLTCSKQQGLEAARKLRKK